MAQIQGLSDTFDVKSLFFLQPVPWFGQHSGNDVNAAFPFGNKSTAQAAYGMIIKSFERRANGQSLAHLLWDNEAPFVDATHYSDHANRELAMAIAKTLRPMLPR